MFKTNISDLWKCQYCRSNFLFLLAGFLTFFGTYPIIALPLIYIAGINAGKKLLLNEVTHEGPYYGPEHDEYILEKYGSNPSDEAVEDVLSGRDPLPAKYYEMLDDR